MSGVPLPTAEIPAGTVTVRVDPRLAHQYRHRPSRRAERGGVRQRASTNDAGRAEFSGLKPGAKVKAVTIVDGERLESQEFALPPKPGSALMLVATDPAAATAALRRTASSPTGPARTGIVVLGDQSRFVIELGDGGLNGLQHLSRS